MADISREIENFRSARKGKDVRGSMISLAEKVNKEGENVVANVAVQVTRINNAITLANEAVTDANAATARANETLNHADDILGSATEQATNSAVSATEAKAGQSVEPGRERERIPITASITADRPGPMRIMLKMTQTEPRSIHRL